MIDADSILGPLEQEEADVLDHNPFSYEAHKPTHITVNSSGSQEGSFSINQTTTTDLS